MSEVLTTKGIAKIVGKELNMPTRNAKYITELIFDVIKEHLKKEKPVSIDGFGRFVVKQYSGGTCYGAEYTDYKKVRFKQFTDLENMIEGNY